MNGCTLHPDVRRYCRLTLATSSIQGLHACMSRMVGRSIQANMMGCTAVLVLLHQLGQDAWP